MDEINIAGTFMTGLLSKILRNVIRKKSGYDIKPDLRSLNVKYKDDKVVVECHTIIEIPKDELLKIIKDNGLL